MRYKTLGFKWLFKHSTTHQVWCNWTGKYSAIPNVSYRQNVVRLHSKTPEHRRKIQKNVVNL